ncbi:sialate O-acetylesterase [Evansella tamaricis]|uniref:Sialate O-acetylesterase n=1 Tax=Evansella tamaricis TaxID=2069301 RepID=A0ABS6JFL9_9BACI|nr:sialate O-acetylesterase [Evansella tamaricis]MBU9712014.1 sialate O-acetylesterase [Evansella tamaricis]
MNISSILSDGMVLQRNAKVSIWGKSKSFQKIKVVFLEKIYETKTGENGNWEITLNGLEPGGPFQMVISDENESVINDILIGDVWILGGQSNMQLPVNRTLDLFREEIKTVNQPYIRQFTVPQYYDFHHPKKDIHGGKWISANSDDVMFFSAVGYFFASELHKKYEVPIGLILTAIGGTPIEAWMSENTLRKIGGYEETLEKCKDDFYVSTTIKSEDESSGEWFKYLQENDPGLKEEWYHNSYSSKEWEEVEVPLSWEGTPLEDVRGSVWFRKEITIPDSLANFKGRLSLGTIIDADDTYVNGIRIGSTGYMYPPRRYEIPEGVLQPGKNIITVRVISTQNIGGFVKDMPYKLIVNGEIFDLKGTWRYRLGIRTNDLLPQTFFQYFPSGLFNGMISPLQNYKMKGVLWYQGESNTEHPQGYRELFEGLTKDWRTLWDIGDFPFIFTQLANFDTGKKNKESNKWAELRDEQKAGLAVSNTGMAVAIDIGESNDLHPQDKKTLGKRLALCAQKLAYNENIVASGPIYKEMEIIEETVHIYFDHVGSGLISRNGELQQFMICGKDRRFYEAKAVISNNTVIVSHEKIKSPVHVRYAWADNPKGANLYNLEGLPASPFTTEHIED